MPSDEKPLATGATTTTCTRTVTISAGFARTTRTALGRSARLHLWRRSRTCPACNAGEGEVPRMPEGFRVEVDKDGWRH
jgi:hypothetical protein